MNKNDLTAGLESEDLEFHNINDLVVDWSGPEPIVFDRRLGKFLPKSTAPGANRPDRPFPRPRSLDRRWGTNSPQSELQVDSSPIDVLPLGASRSPFTITLTAQVRAQLVAVLSTSVAATEVD